MVKASGVKVKGLSPLGKSGFTSRGNLDQLATQVGLTLPDQLLTRVALNKAMPTSPTVLVSSADFEQNEDCKAIVKGLMGSPEKQAKFRQLVTEAFEHTLKGSRFDSKIRDMSLELDFPKFGIGTPFAVVTYKLVPNAKPQAAAGDDFSDE